MLPIAIRKREELPFGRAFKLYIQRLETRSLDLSRSLDIAKCEPNDLADRLRQLESHRLHAKEHQQKCIRQCCMEVISFNID